MIDEAPGLFGLKAPRFRLKDSHTYIKEQWSATTGNAKTLWRVRIGCPTLAERASQTTSLPGLASPDLLAFAPIPHHLMLTDKLGWFSRPSFVLAREDASPQA